jgi:hypothetical protein
MSGRKSPGYSNYEGSMYDQGEESSQAPSNQYKRQAPQFGTADKATRNPSIQTS